MAKSMVEIREMMKQVQDPSLFENTTQKNTKMSLVEKINKNNLYVSSSMIYSNMVNEEAEQQSKANNENKQVVTEDNIKLAGALYAMKEVLSETISKENSVKLFQEISKIFKKL